MLGGADVDGGAGLAVLDLLAGPAGQLAAGRRGPAKCLRNGVERHAENVVQDERHPLGGAEPLQHDKQGQLDVVVEGDPIGRVDGRLLAYGRLTGRYELDLAGVVRAFPA